MFSNLMNTLKSKVITTNDVRIVLFIVTVVLFILGAGAPSEGDSARSSCSGTPHHLCTSKTDPQKTAFVPTRDSLAGFICGHSAGAYVRNSCGRQVYP